MLGNFLVRSRQVQKSGLNKDEHQAIVPSQRRRRIKSTSSIAAFYNSKISMQEDSVWRDALVNGALGVSANGLPRATSKCATCSNGESFLECFYWLMSPNRQFVIETVSCRH